ncbi:hypothetical protein [Pseudoclavibacter sp. 8L]|uniref:hypothetical protein n=1 Tax=Pseudoclavibacter sp. 8L TaxID=2653162 RepID=UPI0012F32A69|nr:hypothetical protein [Pseudoclavibacter sp. 8L]VXB32246.1 hypothetical protein PSCLAVI8L_130478 [Pseudoclavibacter sp. 8L]
MSDVVKLTVGEKQPVKLTTEVALPDEVIDGIPPDTIKQWDEETLAAAQRYARDRIAEIQFPPAGVTKTYVDEANTAQDELTAEMREQIDVALLQIIQGYVAADQQLDTSLRAHVAQAVGTVAWSNLPGRPSTFPPSTHSHQFSELAGVIGNAQMPAAVWDDITGFQDPDCFDPLQTGVRALICRIGPDVTVVFKGRTTAGTGTVTARVVIPAKYNFHVSSTNPPVNDFTVGLARVGNGTTNMNINSLALYNGHRCLIGQGIGRAADWSGTFNWKTIAPLT